MRIKTVNIEEDVEKVLRDAVLDGTSLTLSGQLDRNLYTKTMKVLEKIGFKWNRSKKCHIGDTESASKLLEGLKTGKVVDEKQTYQFFETPPDIAEKIVKISGIMFYHSVLEPSAGTGALIKAILKECPAMKNIYACELEPKMQEALKKMERVIVVGDDFLKHKGSYDRIIMNPPFSNGQDIEHVMHAYSLLNEKGILVSIMSRSWLYNSGNKFIKFREFVNEVGKTGDSYWEFIEEGAFKNSGTQIGTLFLVLAK